MLLHTCARLKMLGLGVGFAVLLSLSSMAEPKCTQVCNLALASYYIQSGQSLSEISDYLKASISEIHSYNPQIPNPDSIQSDTRINVPFSCGCVNDSFLGYIIKYQIQKGDTYDKVAKFHYSNLTTASWIQSFNSYPVTNIPEGATINVMVNCSCGNASVSNAYGLFVTYPLRPGESLSSIAQQMNLSQSLLRSYNPTADFSAGTGLVYIPGKGKNETYLPLGSGGNGRGSSGAGGVIAGVCGAVIAGLIILAAGVYYMRRKKRKQALLLPDKPEYQLAQAVSTGQAGGGDVVSGITVDKSVEFFYEELAKATDNFSLANKIGQGGFGAVYYAELRGEKAAIKKMDMQASREFLAELKVLTRVHHLNLVRLIGYCTEGSLCLVYEFIDNGNLTQHLRGSGRDPLTWSARVQIALDSARGLEYIHEHTVPVYIHRDIKSANILIDQNFHAKVADFGLTKLAEVGNASMPTRLVGTFGYMPPEYAQFGDVSPKVDVYAFGVVLYELISAKEAVLKENGSVVESKGLVALFEDVFSNSDPNELCKLVDPRLGEDYPLDSVCKVAELGRACTQENPELRPSMRSIVVALMALSSTTESWNIGAFYDDHSLVNLMSGR